MIDQTAIGVAIITLIGVVITQYVTYQVQKADRIAGVKDARKAEEARCTVDCPQYSIYFLILICIIIYEFKN